VAAAVARIRGIQSQCGPDLGRLLLTRWKLKAFRHDADDDALQAVEVRLTAHDLGITCKSALPGAIGNVCDNLSSGDIIGLRNEPPGNRRYGKRFQQSAAHVCRGNAHGLRFSSEIRAAGNPRIERRPGMCIPVQIQEFRSGSPKSVQAAVWKRRKLGVHADELLGMRVRKRMEEDGINYSEYPGGGSNPKHQA